MISDEEAKAAQEVAKVTGKSIELSKKVAHFLCKFIGTAPEEVGEIVTNWVRYYKFKNFLAISDLVEGVIEQRKLAGKTIPLKARIGIPLLEAATQENDSDLQTMWASLIVTASDPTRSGEVGRIFITILSAFDPLDAEILKSLPMPYTRSSVFNEADAGRSPSGMSIAWIAASVGVSEDLALIHTHNLCRLGCASFQRDISRDSIASTGFGLPDVNSKARYTRSVLGQALIVACGN